MPVKVFVSDATRQFAHNLDDLRERWNIRREPPTEFEWMPVAVFAQAVAVLDGSALTSVRQGLVEIQHQVRTKIRKEHQTAYKLHEKIDSDLIQELVFARDSVGRHLLVVHDELTARKRKSHEVRNALFSQRFIDAAKEILPSDVYESIIDRAKTPDNARQ